MIKLLGLFIFLLGAPGNMVWHHEVQMIMRMAWALAILPDTSASIWKLVFIHFKRL